MRRSYLDMVALSTRTFSAGETSRYNRESAIDTESLSVALAPKAIHKNNILKINDFISVSLLVNIKNQIIAIARARQPIIHQAIAEEVVNL